MNISVALCTFNGAKYLREQLDSIRDQTVLPDELVIGDDCSTDDTLSIIEKFAEAAPFPVRLVVNEQNLGSTINFERTIRRCNGELIFLCDQDDIWMKEKIESIKSEFGKSSETGMIFTNAEIVNEELYSRKKQLWNFRVLPEHRKEIERGEFFQAFLWENVAIGATIAFRSGFRESFLPIPERAPNLIHDAWIAMVIAAQAPVKYIETPLIKYRQHRGQQIGVNYEKQNRQTRNERSIAFCHAEIARLEWMREHARRFTTFHLAETRGSFDALIETYLQDKRELVKHLTARRDLPGSMLKRSVPVWRELKTGRYSRFSKGWLSAAKDFWEND